MIGAGTIHEVSIDDGTTWINTAKLKDISPPEESRAASEDSYLDNVDKYKEYVSGMIDAGEVQITLKWDKIDVGQVALNAAFEGDGYVMGRITLPDSSTFTYTAALTGRGIAIPKEETVTRSYTMKVSGKPTWA